MASLYPVAGKKIYIGPTITVPNRDMVAGDFPAANAATWKEIDGWETHGSLGDSAQTITTSLINRGRDIKQKGTKNAGSMQNNFAILPDDAGQNALRAAVNSNDDNAYRIVWPTGEIQLFAGLAMSAQDQGGGANTIAMLQATIEVNSNIVLVPKPSGGA